MSKIEEQFEKSSLDLLHDWKKGLTQEEINERFNELFRIAEKSDTLQENISLRDISDYIGFVVINLGKSLEDISDEEFITYIKTTILSTKKYHFYHPVYGFYNFPKEIKLGFSTTLTFDVLPEEIQKGFISMWKHHFEIDTEYAKTTEEFIDRKKASLFIHSIVDANGPFIAMEKASNLANESINIIRFLYCVHFPIDECRFAIEGSKNVGGIEGVGATFHGSATYVARFDKKISELTEILTKSNPSTIERKIKNALRIFGIQTSVTNDQVSFVLLVTCLESLLLTDSDRDYMGWKLAEKTAFLLGNNKRKVNEYIKLAYKKRSAFIHEKTEKRKDEAITKNDVFTMENIVVAIFHKLMEFREQGYVEVEKKKDVKNIDEHIEEMKFGK